MSDEYKSKIEGVYYEKARKKWVASIWIKGKKIKRRFVKQDDAEKARLNAEINKEFILSLLKQNKINTDEDYIKKLFLTPAGGFKEMRIHLNDIGVNNGLYEKTLDEMFQGKMIEVLSNIKNMMTDESERQIQIIIGIKPEDEDRKNIRITYGIKAKTAPETSKGIVYDVRELQPAVTGKHIAGQIDIRDMDVDSDAVED